jgi:chromosome segregation ATPase
MLSDSSPTIGSSNNQSSDDNNHTYSLPPFANDENKALSRKIKTKETNLNSLNSVFDDNAARADTMRAHMKNVQQEYVHTQALYEAKSRQIETEDHFKLLAEREAGRLENEITKKEDDGQKIQDNLTVVQAGIYKTSEQIENLRAELKFSKEELEEWARVQTEKEDDTHALLKYSKEDSAKIKQLGLTMEKLMHDVQKKKAALNAEVTETQVSQIELDKTTNEFKRLHQERQSLINQWENAIQAMNKRDVEIQDSQAFFVEQKERIRLLSSEIDEKQGLSANNNSP